jgi:IPT/TIG domain
MPEAHVAQPVNPPPPEKTPPSGWEIAVTGVGLILFVFLLAYMLTRFWPAGLHEGSDGSELRTIQVFRDRWTFNVSLDVQLILLVMTAGGLGSFIHTATSFGDYVGNETLARSWMWWYILRPFIGMTLATVFYLVVRGGFLTTGTGGINPFGIAALAGLVGMFSKQAADKLNEVFNTLFRTAPGEGDSKRKDDLTNPVPMITDLEPKEVEAGTGNVMVTIKGVGFAQGVAIQVNGTNREVKYVNHTQLTATLLPDDVSQAGELELTVVNPPPGGGVSIPIRLKIATKQP